MDAQNIRKWLAEMEVYAARSLKRILNTDLRVKIDHYNDCTSCATCDREFGMLTDKLKVGRHALKRYWAVYRHGVFSKDGLWYPDMSGLSFDWVRDIADDEDKLGNICSSLSHQGLPILDDSCIPYEHTSDVIREVWCTSFALTRNGAGDGKHSAEPSVVSKLYEGWRQAMLDSDILSNDKHVLKQLKEADSYAKYIIQSEDAAAYALWLASKCTLQEMSDSPYKLHIGIAVAVKTVPEVHSISIPMNEEEDDSSYKPGEDESSESFESMERDDSSDPNEERDPNAPKKPMSAFMFFCREHNEHVRSANPTVYPTGIAKILTAMWKELSYQEQAPYRRMFQQDAERYTRDMSTYRPRPKSDDDSSSDHDDESSSDHDESPKKSEKPDPNAPKKPLSGFMFFCRERREQVKKDNPTVLPGGIGKLLGNMWKQLSPPDQEPYRLWARKDAERYVQDMSTYRPHGKDDESAEEHKKSRRMITTRRGANGKDTEQK